MTRPLRIEFPGALYHVTSRGDRQEPIYQDDQDRQAFLHTLAEVVVRFNWRCHAYCLMTNHYHLVVHTPDGNLSKGMRQLNGVYTQASNRRHRQVGHLFQGRFKAILVDQDSYLLQLARYVVLNPVRAGMVKSPGEWYWSSYRAMVGEAPTADWLATDDLLAQFSTQRDEARLRYRHFVAEGSADIWSGLRQQIYLGDEKFVSKMQERAPVQLDPVNVSQVQCRKPALSLAEISAKHHERNAVMLEAYATGVYSYREIAEHLGVHPATVGRVLRHQMLQCET